jgi:MFS family permease
LQKYKNHVLIAIVMLLFGTLVATAQYKVTPFMNNFAGDPFNLGGNVSWVMSIFTFVGIILAIPTGNLAKRFGPKNILIAALGFVLVGTIIGLVALAMGNGAILIVSRAVEGVAVIFTTICGPLAVQKYVAPDKVGSATGIWALWVCLGSVVGGTLTPIIWSAFGGIEAGYSAIWYIAPWIIYAVITIIFALLVMVIVKIPGEVKKKAADTAAEAAAGPQGHYKDLFNGNAIIFLIGWTLFNLSMLAMLNYTPTFLQDAGWDKTVAGFVSTLPMLLAIISSPLFGWLTDKTGKYKVLVFIAFIVIGPCTWVMLTQSGPIIWVAAVIYGVVGMGAPVMFINCWNFVVGKPELMAIGMGVLMLVQSLGQFLGTFVSPFFLGPNMKDPGNFGVLAIAMLILAVIGSICVLITSYKSGKENA